MDISSCPPLDRISNLPDKIIDNILVSLTLCDAAKTSILAKQWRYKWHNLPQLVFEDALWKKSKRSKKLARMKFEDIFYQVLLRHEGPITKLSLTVPELRGGSVIDNLMYIVRKEGVEEFILKFDDEKYGLPSSLFMCSQLKCLSLYCCSISPPPSFKGFSKLIRLELDEVTIDTEELGNLISSSPLLEQLSLHCPKELDDLEINAPMLKFFELSCYRTPIHVKNSPHLARISLAAYGLESPFGDGICNLGEFFSSVPALQELQLDYHFVKLFSEDHKVQPGVTAHLQSLKTLYLSTITMDIVDEVFGTLFLIRNCPNLEELNVENDAYGDDEPTEYLVQNLKEQDYSDVLLNRLQKVTLGSLTGVPSEMVVIKLLLEKSPMLKRMVFKWYNQRFVGIVNELNKFRRASPNAELILVDD